jgi:uracil-DNA glycosylase family 4
MLIYDSPFHSDVTAESIGTNKEYNNYLNNHLKQIGLNTESIYVTSFIKCFISDKKKKPTKPMKEKCVELYLDKEIRSIKPKVLLLMGRMVTQYFIPEVTPKVPLKQVIGKSFYNAEYQCYVIPVYDMYYLTNFSDKSAQVRQTGKAFARVKVHLGGGEIKANRPKISYSYNLEDVAKLGDYITVDVETSGLNPRRDKILTVGISDGKLHTSFDFMAYKDKDSEVIENEDGTFTVKGFKEFYAKVIPFLIKEIRKRKIVGHNMLFDLGMFLAAGHDITDNMVADTRMMQFLINPNGANALGFLVQLYYGIAYKEDIDRSQIIKMEMEDRRYYCAEDVYYTHRLFLDLFKQLKAQDSLISNKVLTDVIRNLVFLESKGIRVDLKVIEELIEFYGKERDACVEKFKKRFKLTEEFNLNSPKQLCKLLYDELGLPVLVRTKTRDAKTGEYNPSTNEEAITKLAERRPALSVLVDYRTNKGHIEKLKGYREAVAEDGRIHSSFNPFSPDSSRLMSSKPNIQNVPRKSRLKEVFVPAPGYTYVYYDYCLSPETRLLTYDFKHIPCGNLKVGDTLIGFEEHGINRKLKKSNIERIEKFIRPCYRITTEEGSFICSEEHKWLFTSKKRGQTPVWTMTQNMHVNGYLTKISEVWDTPNTYDAGWMAGFLDGEGNISHGSCIAWGQKNSGDNTHVFNRALKIAKHHGLKDLRFNLSSSGCTRVMPAGLRQGWKTIGIFQPERLKIKAQRLLEKQSTRGHNNRKVKILSMEFIGNREVVGIRTSTHTFIAEGFMSHNCQIEFRVWIDLAKDPKGIEFINAGRDIHAFIASQFYRMPEAYFLDKSNEDGKEKRNRVKAIVYGSMYGRTPEGIVREHGGSVDDAAAIQAIFFSLCKKGWFWLQQIEQEILKTKRLRTPFGTYRYFNDIELATPREKEELIRQAKSFIVQSWAAELGFIGIAKVCRKIREQKLDATWIHNIHDANKFEVLNAHVEQTKAIILSEAQSPYSKMSIPLTVEIKTGHSWAEVA